MFLTYLLYSPWSFSFYCDKIEQLTLLSIYSSIILSSLAHSLVPLTTTLATNTSVTTPCPASLTFSSISSLNGLTRSRPPPSHTCQLPNSSPCLVSGLSLNTPPLLPFLYLHCVFYLLRAYTSISERVVTSLSLPTHSYATTHAFLCCSLVTRTDI